MLSFLRRYRVVLLIYTLLLIAGLILLATFGKADIHIVINRHTTAFGDFIMKYITHMGDGIFAAAVIILLLFVSIRMSLGQLMAFLSSGIIAQALKKLVFSGMPRPSVFFEGIYNLHLVEGIRISRYNTFPSGHSATTFAIFLCLIFTTRNRWLQTFYFCMAWIVGFSRIYLSQHFISDVLAGSFIGVSMAMLSVYVVSRWKAQWLDTSLQDHLFAKK